METPARLCPPARPSAEMGFRRGRRVITAPQAESLLLLQMLLLSNVALLISTPICFLLWFLSGTKAWLFALVGNSIQSSLLKSKKMRELATLPALSPQTHLKASGAEHRAQVTAARVSIGGGGGEPPPLPALGGPRSVQPAAAPSRRRRWNCFSWSVCSFSLHTRGTAREETSGCQFST